MTVTVDAAPIVAVADPVTGVNGASGQVNAVNVLLNDTLNGVAATAATVSLSAASPVPPELSFDAATGNVSVAAGTAAGSYSFDYQICEVLNPANCATATVTVTVDPPAPATVSGVVFIDNNNNGSQDMGEPGAGAGYTVELRDGFGTLVASATTAADGSYTFSAPPGLGYMVIFLSPTAVEVGRINSLDLSAGATVIDQNLALGVASTTHTFTKTAGVTSARRGEKIPYTIKATAMTGGPFQVVDALPSGTSYVAGSAAVNGTLVTPVVNGRELLFDNLLPDAGGAIVVEVTLQVTGAAAGGTVTNNARLVEQVSGVVLARAKAVTPIAPEHVFDCGEVIGRVFDDKNRNGYADDGEPGLPGVRVATVKGLLVTTDPFGRFHVACADIPDAASGSNFIMKLDSRTLPTGYRLTTENPRDVRLTRGKVTKLNFGASIGRVVRLDVKDEAFIAGSTELAPQWASGIEELMATLGSEPSTLRLTYFAGAEGRTLANRRTAALKKLIALRWNKHGAAYDLPVEVRLVVGK